MAVWIPKDDFNNLDTPALCDIRVSLKWDTTTGKTKMMIGQKPVEDLNKLEGIIQENIDAYKKTGKSIMPPLETTDSREQGDIIVIIDSELNVPWHNVVDVIDICKKLNIAFEFEFKYPNK